METIRTKVNTVKLGLVFPQPEPKEDEPIVVLTDKQRIARAIVKFLRQEAHTYERRQHQRSVALTDDDLIATELTGP